MKTYKMAVFASLKMTLEICGFLNMINNKKIIVMSFESIKSFLFELKMDSDINMIFWEVEEKENYPFLSKIRKYNKSAKIIIVSKLKRSDSALQNMGNSIYTLDSNQLKNLDVVFNQLLSISTDDNADKIFINGINLFPMKILFIETYCEHKNCVIIHDDKPKVIRSALTNFEQLRHYLVKVDRSLIVNLNKIKRIDFQKAIIYFENSDDTAKVSFSNLKKLENILEKFKESN